MSIRAIQEQLKSLGCSAISLQDNFESTVECDACQVTLKFQSSFQAIWFLKRHIGQKTHQVKAGWILDGENNIKRSKPKGLLNIHVCFLSFLSRFSAKEH